MRVLIATDAWHPQRNGVVRTVELVARCLRERGDVVEVLGPDRFPGIAAPSYPEIRLALAGASRLGEAVDRFRPDAVHIATEGPLGWAARRLCLRRGWPFTTSFHTRFPDYLHARIGLPRRWTWALLRRFHRPADAVLAPTATLAGELAGRGFRNAAAWSRGVDLECFRPDAGDDAPDPFAGLPRPVWLCAGRVAVEKNLAAFLALDLPGSKVVAGDGPQRAALERRFPAARFLGGRDNAALAPLYAAADAFVFPSRTDTFGLVLLEALACGTPVAAFPVPGPLDVLGDAPVGALDDDLRAACLRALGADRAACRRHAEGFSWQHCAGRFRDALTPLPPRP